ncbi:TPA: hypothetical protein PCO47_005664 [Klebsiella pneumoniae]|nr:hypothetical protein [Klebsiella pneumoniae]
MTNPLNQQADQTVVVNAFSKSLKAVREDPRGLLCMAYQAWRCAVFIHQQLHQMAAL